jgi:hypothetical protein
VKAVRKRKKSIQKGWSICSFTKKVAVTMMTVAIIIDFDAAAPTYPKTISKTEMGAERIS